MCTLKRENTVFILLLIFTFLLLLSCNSEESDNPGNIGDIDESYSDKDSSDKIDKNESEKKDADVSDFDSDLEVEQTVDNIAIDQEIKDEDIWNDTNILNSDADPIAAYCEKLKTDPQPVLPLGPFSAGFNVYHGKSCGDNCHDFGKTLVGAAALYPDSILWSEQRAVFILESGNDFGFSGKSIYLKEQASFSADNWVMTTISEFTIEVPKGGTKHMGAFFAPMTSGLRTVPNLYKGMILDDSGTVTDIQTAEVNLHGTGVADDNSALTMDVKLMSGTSDICSDPGRCTPCKDSPENCFFVEVDSGQEIDFHITTFVDPEKVSKEAEQVTKTYLNLIYKDVDTNCGSATFDPHQTFETHSTKSNNFNFNSYYHFLSSHGPSLTDPRCNYSVDFLISPCIEFTLHTANKRTTDAGYASFTFAFRGHYDPLYISKWPKGRKTYRFKTKK